MICRTSSYLLLGAALGPLLSSINKRMEYADGLNGPSARILTKVIFDSFVAKVNRRVSGLTFHTTSRPYKVYVRATFPLLVMDILKEASSASVISLSTGVTATVEVAETKREESNKRNTATMNVFHLTF